MNHRIISFLIICVMAVTLTACGDSTSSNYVSPQEFCAQGHGGVNEDTWEDDGDVECNDGTEYEGDGDSASEEESGGSHKKKAKKFGKKLKSFKSKKR